MVSNQQVRIVGTLLLVAGLLALLFGVFTWSKQWLATGFIAILIALTLLYYASQAEHRGP